MTAQGDFHVNTITGETLDFWLFLCVSGPLVLDITRLGEPEGFSCRCCRSFCSTGLWLISSLERVCYTREQPSPSSADRCKRDYPEVIVWGIPEVRIQE